jgi:pimeloyl-ACP methyl ester carboxylesterase
MPYFETDLIKFHYYQYGSGKEIMLAFHGFGMRGTQFHVLEEAFAEKYTIYSFDLLFHGNTEVKDTSLNAIRTGLKSVDFGTQIENFLNVKGISEVSLLSYSIGSRFALALIEAIPERIYKSFFIAPDGIQPNRLLSLGERNPLINILFYKLVYSPRTVKFCLNQLYKLKYIDASLHRILDFEFGTVETRLTCYNTITYFNKLRFQKKKLAELINNHQIDCHFYFGKKDKLFPASIGLDFGKLLTRSQVHVFDEGHELINSQLNQYLKEQFKSND